MFFPKFATTICCTVLSALIYSLVFFMSLCIAGGPTGTTGSLEAFSNRIRKKLNQDVTPYTVERIRDEKSR